MNVKDSFRSRSSERDDADPGLTQDCVIEWMDDDDRFPEKQQKMDLLFQSPTSETSPARDAVSEWKSYAHGDFRSASTQHLQPLRTQPFLDNHENQTTSFLAHKRRRRQLRNEEYSNVDPPTQQNNGDAKSNSNTAYENTPKIKIDANTKTNDHGLLFDLPTCWKDNFQMRPMDTPAGSASNVLDTSMAMDTHASSVSQEVSRSPSNNNNHQQDELHTSCRVDLGSIFHTTNEAPSNVPCTISAEMNTNIQDSSFDFVDWNEDDFAAVEAAIQARQASQELLGPSSSSSLSAMDPRNVSDASATKTPSDVITDTAFVVTSDDVFGDFPDIDFDIVDQLVAKRQIDVMSLQDSNKPNIVTPVNASNEHEFIRFSRYIICTVREDTHSYEKILGVKLWTSIKDESKHLGSTHPLAGGSDASSRATLIQPDGYVHLRGEWYHAKCETGDIIHICSLSGRFDTSPTAFPIVLNTQASGADDNDLVLVVHPDFLVTPTAISETIHCNRRAVLMTRLGSNGLSTNAAMMGTLRHDLFERCLFHKDFSEEFARNQCTSIIRNHAESLIGIGMLNEFEIQSELMKTLPLLQRFSSEYTSFSQPSSGLKSLSSGSLVPGHGMQSGLHVLIDDIHATEESSVSHELGLRGFIDATVEMRGVNSEPMIQMVHGENSNCEGSSLQGSNPSKGGALVAIELKTGHNQNAQHAHMAQLSLYTIMLRARYGSARVDSTGRLNSCTGQIGASESGILLYLNNQSHKAIHISPSIGEIKSLINQRNVVASEIRRSLKPRGLGIVSEENDMNAANDAQQAHKKERIILQPAPPSELPDLLFAVNSCERCYSNRECMVYAKSDILDFEDTSGIAKTHKDLLEKFTGHLAAQELKYFREWDRLIDCEAFSSNHEIARAWLVDSSESEVATGKCISSLIFDESSFLLTSGEDDSVLVKLYRSPYATIKTPINALKFSLGDVVVLSTDHVSFNDDWLNQQHSVARHRKMHILKGTVKRLEENHLYLRLSQRDIRQVMNIIKQRSSSDPFVECGVCFRLDKDESTVATTTLRKNLIEFFTLDTPTSNTMDDGEVGTPNKTNDAVISKRGSLSDLIIGLKEPRFEITAPLVLFGAPNDKLLSEIQGCEMDALIKDYSKLNVDQKAAVQKVFSAKDYTLIQGLPGSGKTSTISFVARLLAAHGKRVLITSYTHAAVDTLLIKIMEAGVGTLCNRHGLYDIVRVGVDSQVHGKVRSVTVSNLAAEYEKSSNTVDASMKGGRSKPSIQSLHRILNAARIVGVSTLSIPRTPLLSRMHFDVVIVDEAGQISQPAILGALVKGETFVLVGDHEQLPPLVQNPVAEQGGYGVSMLKRLAEAHPTSVAQLTLQYRMNEAICSLCNEVVYKGKLRCANDEVFKGKLQLEGFPGSLSKIKLNWKPGSGVGWLLQVINPNKGVVFIDTDSLIHNSDGAQVQWLEISRGRDAEGGNMINATESVLSRIIVHGLLSCGLKPDMIGLISPYRSQIKYLDEDPFLSSRKKHGLEISTIDKYQGRDKEAIIVSLVRSNHQGKTGRLLEDYRRLNVAFSRAKHKLIILGSCRTLMRGSSVLGPLVEFMKGKGWIESLPDNALQIYEEPI